MIFVEQCPCGDGALEPSETNGRWRPPWNLFRKEDDVWRTWTVGAIDPSSTRGPSIRSYPVGLASTVASGGNGRGTCDAPRHGSVDRCGGDRYGVAAVDHGVSGRQRPSW